MSTRIRINQAEPAGYRVMVEMNKYVEASRLSRTHKDLIKIRVSQVNGCAYCIDLHTRDARKAGETEQRIYALNAWRETPFFTPEERAILALAEAVTFIHRHVSDEVYQEAARLFDEQYLSQIIMAIININGWTRIGIATAMSPALAAEG